MTVGCITLSLKSENIQCEDNKVTDSKHNKTVLSSVAISAFKSDRSVNLPWKGSHPHPALFYSE